MDISIATAIENFLGGDDHATPMPLDYYVWVVKSDERTIVVDTGFEASAAAGRGRTLIRPVDEGLAAIGVDAHAVLEWNPGTFVWQTTSKQAADGTENKFGGQLLTRVTGAAPLKLPMELDGNPTREIIKRRLPTDSLPPPVDTSPLTDARYHSKAEIRILIDDEGVANDAAGLYGTQNADVANNPHNGVTLSTFDPMMLPNGTVASVRQSVVAHPRQQHHRQQ